MPGLEFRSSLRFPALTSLIALPLAGHLFYLGALPWRTPVPGQSDLILWCASAVILGIGLVVGTVMTWFLAAGQRLTLEPTRLTYWGGARELQFRWDELQVVASAARPFQRLLLSDGQQHVNIYRVHFPDYVAIVRLVERKRRETQSRPLNV